MADEKIVFEVDVTSLAKALADSQTQLEIYKRDMEAAVEANGRFSEQANKAAGLVAAQTKAVQQQTGAITRLTQAELALGGSINEIVKSYDAENKSVDQNRKVLNALTAEYNNLSGTQRTNLIPTIKAVSDELKKQEGAIGDTRRNVGNYFNEFAKGIPVLGSVIDPLKNIVGSFKDAGGGVNGLSSAMSGGLLAAIPLVIAGFEGLIDIAKGFDSIANQVEDSTAGLKLGFQEFTAEIITSGVSFKEAINNFQEYQKVGAKLSKNARDLKDAQNLQNVSNAQLASSEEVLLIKLKNQNIESAEKLRLADEFAKKEQKNFEAQKKIIDAQVKDALKVALIAQDNGQGYDAAQEKYYALLTTQKKLIGEKAVLDEKIKTRTDAIIADDLKKKEEAALKEKLLIEKAKEQSDRIIDAQNKRAEIAASLYKKTQEEKFAALKKFDEANKKAIEDRAKAEEDLTNRELDAQVRQAQITANRVGSVNARIDAELIARQRLLENEKLTATERENIIRESEDKIKGIRQTAANEDIAIEKQKEQDRATVISASVQFITGLIATIGQALQEASNQQIEQETKANEERQNSYKRSLEAGLISKEEFNKLTAESDAKLAEETREQNRKAWEANKAIQITMAIINTAQAVIAQISNPTPFVGFVLSALAAATGAIQIGIIAAQQPPKFATGVIGLDGEGTETSDSIDARLSKGESVLTAKATRKYHRQLAYMEMSVGNKPNYQFGGGMFAGGFIPSVSGDGGFLARETVKQSDSALMMSEAIRNGFALAPAPVLSIVELNTKQRDINRSVNLSEA